jgi:hypothetical protein
MTLVARPFSFVKLKTEIGRCLVSSNFQCKMLWAKEDLLFLEKKL